MNKNPTKPEKIFNIFLFLLPSLIFFMLNYFTPLVGDDYPLSFIWGTTQRISSLSDFFISSQNAYMTYGGRSVAVFLTQIMLFIGEKNVFNIINTIVYNAFILLVIFHSSGTLKNIKPVYFILINIVFWFFVPVWGECFLWLGGTCFYLWTTILILLFLIPYRLKLDNPDYNINNILSILFLFLGVLAGWSIENSGAAVLVLLLFYFIAKKKEKVSLFEILGFIGFLIGLTFLLAAPGNYARIVRTEVKIYNHEFFINIIKSFIRCTKKLLTREIYILISLLILFGFDLVIHLKRKLNKFIWCYVIAGFAGIYSMVLSPSFTTRPTFIIVVFFIIVILNLYEQIKGEMPEIIKRNKCVILLLIFIGFGGSLITASQRIWTIRSLWRSRSEYILSQKKAGNVDLELNILFNDQFTDKHGVLYECPDITKTPDSLLNRTIAAYYGVKTITGIEVTDNP
jgi:hypothetical protein